MDKITRLLYKELYRRSLYEFVKAFWNTCDPSKFIGGDLIEYYCEVFQYMCRNWTKEYAEISISLPPLTDDSNVIDIRSKNHNLCLNVPPRHTKSMIFNVFGPVWLWIHYPVKVASISHTAGLATQMNSKRYSIINSDKFKELFPEIKLNSNTKSYLSDSRGGELYSLNRNAFTGYGGDIIINDDLTNAETARKDKEEMNNAWSYYQNTMPSRINDINKCIIMNIQQRLAPNDITGHILGDSNLSKQYIFITLPAIFTKDTYLIYPISGKIKLFKKGDVLWKERFGSYESLRAQVGESIFETQYLQNPIATDKTIVKEDMIHEVDLIDVPDIENADMIYASHDFPIMDKEDSDNLGSVLAYRIGSNLYIIDGLEKKMAYNKSVTYVKQLDSLYPGMIQVIEDKANGSPILQQLQDEVPGLQAFQPGSNSKSQRLESATLYMISNNVKFVKSEINDNKYVLRSSLVNLKNKLLNFPFVEHDDIVDAFSQLVLFVFMDKRYCVYARSFNDNNIVNIENLKNIRYSNVFFNKEGDIFKVLEIAVLYGEHTKIVVKSEMRFKSSIEDAINVIKNKYNKNVIIDCSNTDALYGIYNKGVSIEKYKEDDFDKSVSQLSLAFSKNLVLLDKNCKLCKSEIENFKFNKSKNDNVKYVTEKDGFIACLRIALKYYGGIV